MENPVGTGYPCPDCKWIQEDIIKLTTSFTDCQTQRALHNSALFSKLDEKVSVKIFTWAVGGMGAVGMGIILTLIAQLGTMHSIDSKVDIAVVQQETIRYELKHLSDRLDKSEAAASAERSYHRNREGN